MKGEILSVLNALAPIFYGAALAFLANPLVDRVEAWLKARSFKKGARGIGIAAAILVYGLFIYIAFHLIVPRLAKTLVGLVYELPLMMQRLFKWIEEMLRQDEDLYRLAESLWEQINAKFKVWLQDGLATTLMSTLMSVANGVYNIAAVVVNAASAVFDILVAVVVMVYLLLDKDKFVGQSKKILYAVCRKKKIAAAVLDVARETNRIFNGFISGKLLDSLIVGILCFICLSLLKMPYALLVSVIIGVTNVIPVFGPFIGAIPSAFLILLADPMKCLIFIIFIIILQQIDGNIIGPMILGDSTGLSAFWVTFSILLFGKLMGVVGMILGVPLFATFYYIVKRLTESLLRRRSLPTKTGDYVNIDYIDEDDGIHYLNGKTGCRSSRRGLKFTRYINEMKSLKKGRRSEHPEEQQNKQEGAENHYEDKADKF